MSTFESDSEQLLVEQHDRVLLLTLNRPEARNALSDDITGNLRRAVAWVYKNAAKFNGSRAKIYVSGHSAGGHLTAMLAATDWLILMAVFCAALFLPLRATARLVARRRNRRGPCQP